MATNPVKIGKLEISQETTYGTASGGSYAAMEAEPTFLPVAAEIFERAPIGGIHRKLQPLQGSRYGQTFTTRCRVIGHSTSVPVADPSEHWQAQVCESILGGIDIEGYNAAAVASGSSTTAVKIDNGTAVSNFTLGGAIGFVNGSSAYGMSFISAITDGGGSDHTLTVATLPITPVAGSTTYGGMTTYWSNTAPTSFTIRCRSLRNSSRLIATGCVPTQVSFEANPMGELVMEITWQVDAVTASADGSDLTDYAYAYPVIPVAIGNNSAALLLNGTEIDVQSFKVTISQTLAPHRSHDAASGVVGVSRTDASVMVDYVRLVEAAPTLSIASVNPIIFRVGTTPGNMFGIFLGNPVMTQIPELQDADGLWAQGWQVAQGSYTGDGASTELGNTAFRIAWV